jgi:hypothetical protein
MTDKPKPTTSLAIIQDAMANPNVDPDKLQKLLDVQQQWSAEEQRKAFHAAVADFQARCPIIEKADTANGRPYARLDRLWKSIRPLLAECGLSVIWTVCQVEENVCRLEGQLIHRDGHSVDLKRDLPLPDVIRGQNQSQRAGSANTYAKRYALCDCLGVVTGAEAQDDDGNGTGPVGLTEDQRKKLLSLLKDSGADKDEFYAWAECDGIDTFPARRFLQAKKALETRIQKAKGTTHVDPAPAKEGELPL